MADQKEHICVCVCTFRRPELFARVLNALAMQDSQGRFDFSVVVVDNDAARSAESVAMDPARGARLAVRYFMEPMPNIAMARNRAVREARGDYLAFIDDDEFPGADWLRVMWKTSRKHGAAGVLGPVLPDFEPGTPSWIKQGGFYDRRRHATGFEMGWQESRTGNVLLRADILDGVAEVFQSSFGAGGEDQDFFRRMMQAGHKFIWCDEAPAYETVPLHRCRVGFLVRRALLRGKISFQHRRNRARNLVKSLVAVPLYVLALPLLLLGGHHLFMKYFVRLFDHLGRLLALLRLNPMRERNH